MPPKNGKNRLHHDGFGKKSNGALFSQSPPFRDAFRRVAGQKTRLASTAGEFQSLMAGDEGQDHSDFAQLASLNCTQWIQVRDSVFVQSGRAVGAGRSENEPKKAPVVTAGPKVWQRVCCFWGYLNECRHLPGPNWGDYVRCFRDCQSQKLGWVALRGTLWSW